jgi:hypothetical protein
MSQDIRVFVGEDRESVTHHSQVITQLFLDLEPYKHDGEVGRSKQASEVMQGYAAGQFLKAVYTVCGAHVDSLRTHKVYPRDIGFVLTAPRAGISTVVTTSREGARGSDWYDHSIKHLKERLSTDTDLPLTWTPVRAHADGGDMFYHKGRNVMLVGDDLGSKDRGGLNWEMTGWKDERAGKLAQKKQEVAAQLAADLSDITPEGFEHVQVRQLSLVPALQEAYYHLDLHMLQLPDGSFVVMNKSFFTRESMSKLEATGVNIIDLGYDIRRCITDSLLNLFQELEAIGNEKIKKAEAITLSQWKYAGADETERKAINSERQGITKQKEQVASHITEMLHYINQRTNEPASATDDTPTKSQASEGEQELIKTTLASLKQLDLLFPKPASADYFFEDDMDYGDEEMRMRMHMQMLNHLARHRDQQRPSGLHRRLADSWVAVYGGSGAREPSEISCIQQLRDSSTKLQKYLSDIPALTTDLAKTMAYAPPTIAKAIAKINALKAEMAELDEKERKLDAKIAKTKQSYNPAYAFATTPFELQKKITNFLKKNEYSCGGFYDTNFYATLLYDLKMLETCEFLEHNEARAIFYSIFPYINSVMIGKSCVALSMPAGLRDSLSPTLSSNGIHLITPETFMTTSKHYTSDLARDVSGLLRAANFGSARAENLSQLHPSSDLVSQVQVDWLQEVLPTLNRALEQIALPPLSTELEWDSIGRELIRLIQQLNGMAIQQAVDYELRHAFKVAKGYLRLYKELNRAFADFEASSPPLRFASSLNDAGPHCATLVFDYNQLRAIAASLPKAHEVVAEQVMQADNGGGAGDPVVKATPKRQKPAARTSVLVAAGSSGGSKKPKYRIS